MPDYKKIKNSWDNFLESDQTWIDLVIKEQLAGGDWNPNKEGEKKISYRDNKDEKEPSGAAALVPGHSEVCPTVRPGALRCPLKPNNTKIEEPYNPSGGGFHSRGGKHEAIDIGSYNDTVYAIADGEVKQVVNNEDYLRQLLNIILLLKKGSHNGKMEKIELKLFDKDNKEIKLIDGMTVDPLLYISKITDKKGNIVSAKRFRKLIDQYVSRGHRKSLAAGSQVWIWHAQERIWSVYFHLKNATLTKGSVIKQGAKIGLVGKTGIFDPPGDGQGGKPHLHFSIRCGNLGNPVDPLTVYGNRK